jgi:uncharacterized tellurite resistance protein B-like protein
MVDIGKCFHETNVSLPLRITHRVGSAKRLLAMPIVALIVSTLVFWLLYWFIRMGGIQHLQQRAAQHEEEARRLAAREASRMAPLRAIDDPRDAAAILMLLVARAHGDTTREQIEAIENKMRHVFGFGQELTERMTHARFIARQADSFEQAAAVFAPLFKQRLTFYERSELIGMLEEIAGNEGPSEIQTEAIASFKPLIGLVPAR